MEIQTSVNLSDELISVIDQIIGSSGSRSDFIEHVLRQYLKNRLKENLNSIDLKIINNNANSLNEEAEDVLTYQVPL